MPRHRAEPGALPRLCTDQMLGRLARALRFVGLDTTYADEAHRGPVMEDAILEGRAICTRDRKLKTYGCKRIFVVSDHWREQLEQVLDELALDRTSLPAWTRCSRCNQRIEPVAKETVQTVVPPYVYATHEQFHRCPECHRVYWSGSHVVRLNRALGERP